MWMSLALRAPTALPLPAARAVPASSMPALARLPRGPVPAPLEARAAGCLALGSSGARAPPALATRGVVAMACKARGKAAEESSGEPSKSAATPRCVHCVGHLVWDGVRGQRARLSSNAADHHVPGLPTHPPAHPITAGAGASTRASCPRRR